MPGYKLFTVANLYSSIQLIKSNHLDRNPGRQTEMYILASRHTISDKLTGLQTNIKKVVTKTRNMK